MLDYLRTNLRHARSSLMQWLQCRTIEWFAEHWRKQATIPAFDEAAIASLRRANSVVSRLLSLDRGATEAADAVLDGRMRVLNRTLDFGRELPDWHRDHINGGTYRLRPYPQEDGAAGTKSDIVAVWELSRLQFVPCLVQAHRLTGQTRYAEAFYRLLAHWNAANPYLMGVNWACGLDVAVRALQIALALVFLPAPGGEAGKAAARLLWLHILYLEERDLYEPKGTVNNHHLVTLALHYAMLHLYAGDHIEAWRRRALSHLESEVLRQFRADGGNIESAMQYHQFSLESVLVAAGWAAECREGAGSVLDRSGFGSAVVERLQSALRFTADCCRVWGSSPRFGDSSDARVLIHRDYFCWSPSDASYLRDWSALLFGSTDPFTDTTPPATAVYPESGVGLHHCALYDVIALGMPVTDRAAGHNHYDKGSVLLRVGGEDVLVDSGTYCYTSDPRMRAAFRQGRAHNVVLLDGLEQAMAPGGGVFDAPRFGRVTLAREQSEGQGPSFVIEHDGYAGRNGIDLLRRRVSCRQDRIVIEDRILGRGRHKVEVMFNLAPGLVPIVGENAVSIDLTGGYRCDIEALHDFKIATEGGCFSDAYMHRVDTSRVIFWADEALPCEVIFIVRLRRVCK